MPRKLTTYKNPSVGERLMESPDVESHHSLFFYALKNAEASADTRRKWTEIYLNRQMELMISAPTAEVLCFNYNFIKFATGLHPSIAPIFELAFKQRAKQLPSPTQRMREQGIIFEGVP